MAVPAEPAADGYRPTADNQGAVINTDEPSPATPAECCLHPEPMGCTGRTAHKGRTEQTEQTEQTDHADHAAHMDHAAYTERTGRGPSWRPWGELAVGQLIAGAAASLGSGLIALLIVWAQR
ncbi:hypothetical protein ACFXKX_01375 [Streptomyces scopuliridis]|uniref:hypothetical protein n=1 Tax=Streptomyces scopuliridis TaxID=452529 RepID=UPI0036786270